MRRFSLKQLERRDKIGSAFHEAGHALILHYFGYSWEADIWRTGPPTIEKRSWDGQVRSFDLLRASAFRFSVIGWAGSVAQHFLHGDCSGERLPAQWEQVDI